MVVRRMALIQVVAGSFALCGSAQAQWFGQNVIDRTYVDYAHQITFIDPGNVAPTSGYVEAWNLWVKDAGEVYLQVWRPMGSSYQLVGQNLGNFVITGNIVHTIAPAERIAVRAGDLLGFRYEGGFEPKVIAFDMGGGSQIWTAWPDAGAVPVGGSLSLAALSGYGENRSYSLAAKIGPVPEPASLAALGIGLAAMRRRRTKR